MVCPALLARGALLGLLGRGGPMELGALREQGDLQVVLAQGELQGDRACLVGLETLENLASQEDREGHILKTT